MPPCSEESKSDLIQVFDFFIISLATDEIYKFLSCAWFYSSVYKSSILHRLLPPF